MENKNQDYVENEQEREEGHINTRCSDCCADPDEHLGCDPGIDVAG